jgi:hypothetical protein
VSDLKPGQKGNSATLATKIMNLSPTLSANQIPFADVVKAPWRCPLCKANHLLTWLKGDLSVLRPSSVNQPAVFQLISETYLISRWVVGQASDNHDQSAGATQQELLAGISRSPNGLIRVCIVGPCLQRPELNRWALFFCRNNRWPMGIEYHKEMQNLELCAPKIRVAVEPARAVSSPDQICAPV